MLKRFIGTVAGISIMLVMLPLFSVWAAGSAEVTVEGSDSISTGATTELSLYVTASGANLGGVSFDVSLSNLSYQSFNAAGTAFNGYSGVPTGGSVGSTSFQVAASYLGSGSSGKLLIGKVTVKASETAGTGQINISNVQAVDHPDEQSMSASSQNKSLTINTPTPPPADTGSGNTNQNNESGNNSSQTSSDTTPPSSSGSSSTSSTATSTSTPANTTTAPNTQSTAAMPASAEATSNTPAAIVAEQTIADNFAAQEGEDTSSPASVTKKKQTTKWLTIGLPAALVVLLAVTGLLFLHRKKSSVFSPTATTIQPTTGPEPIIPHDDLIQPEQNVKDGQADENYGQDQKV